jgi:hypothetical protein
VPLPESVIIKCATACPPFHPLTPPPPPPPPADLRPSPTPSTPSSLPPPTLSSLFLTIHPHHPRTFSAPALRRCFRSSLIGAPLGGTSRICGVVTFTRRIRSDWFFCSSGESKLKAFYWLENSLSEFQQQKQQQQQQQQLMQAKAPRRLGRLYINYHFLTHSQHATIKVTSPTPPPPTYN